MSTIPVGYKQTEIGVIPEDWEVQIVESFADVKSGKRLPLGKTLTDTPTSHPYIRVADMSMGSVAMDDLKYVPDDVFPYIKNYRIYEDDIFISVAGTLGLIGKIPKELDGANLTENADRLTNIQVNRDYLMYILMSPLIQNTIDAEKTTGAQPKLALIRIRNFLIPLPPTKTEQQLIATALSDTDLLIESLEKLIAKKRQIKQGAMQELLSPKEGWEVKKLGEITDILTGHPFPSSGYVKNGVRLLRGSNIKRGNTDWSEELCQYWPIITSELKRYQLKKGDIVVAMDGSLVGKSFAQLTENDLPALLLQRVARIRSKDITINVNYLKAWVCSELFSVHCDSLKTVTAIPHISPANIHDFVLNIPKNLQDQTTIATILSDMDAEITAIEERLEKTRTLKSGMMHELLTGRIRLV